MTWARVVEIRLRISWLKLWFLSDFPQEMRIAVFRFKWNRVSRQRQCLDDCRHTHVYIALSRAHSESLHSIRCTKINDGKLYSYLCFVYFTHWHNRVLVRARFLYQKPTPNIQINFVSSFHVVSGVVSLVLLHCIVCRWCTMCASCSHLNCFLKCLFITSFSCTRSNHSMVSMWLFTFSSKSAGEYKVHNAIPCLPSLPFHATLRLNGTRKLIGKIKRNDKINIFLFENLYFFFRFRFVFAFSDSISLWSDKSGRAACNEITNKISD